MKGDSTTVWVRGGAGRALSVGVDGAVRQRTFDGLAVVSDGDTALTRDPAGGVLSEATTTTVLKGKTASTVTTAVDVLTDVLGSTVSVASAGVISADLAVFTDFGEPLTTPKWDTVAGFTGQIDTSGLLEFAARTYDPSSATWLQDDPYRGTAARSASLNRYAYVEGAPESFVDAYGFHRAAAILQAGGESAVHRVRRVLPHRPVPDRPVRDRPVPPDPGGSRGQLRGPVARRSRELAHRGQRHRGLADPELGPDGQDSLRPDDRSRPADLRHRLRQHAPRPGRPQHVLRPHLHGQRRRLERGVGGPERQLQPDVRRHHSGVQRLRQLQRRQLRRRPGQCLHRHRHHGPHRRKHTGRAPRRRRYSRCCRKQRGGRGQRCAEDISKLQASDECAAIAAERDPGGLAGSRDATNFRLPEWVLEAGEADG
ncbi:MAG: hypothetical protein HHJ14_08005 [Cellulomonas sp.]|nr:hypothetical protein [Cellulomonas sp.]NMM30266.1 hypothetical protein [Cellulomonas sp.]